jgi:hypothetical protein
LTCLNRIIAKGSPSGRSKMILDNKTYREIKTSNYINKSGIIALGLAILLFISKIQEHKNYYKSVIGHTK